MLEKTNLKDRAKVDKAKIVFASNAQYLGGIMQEMVSKPEQGIIGITDKELIFVNLAMFKKNWVIIRIPLNKILKKEIEQKQVQNIAKDNQMTALSYFAGYGPMSTYKNQTTAIIIPYKDSKSQKQSPIFIIKKIRDFSRNMDSFLNSKNVKEEHDKEKDIEEDDLSEARKLLNK